MQGWIYLAQLGEYLPSMHKTRCHSGTCLFSQNLEVSEPWEPGAGPGGKRGVLSIPGLASGHKTTLSFGKSSSAQCIFLECLLCLKYLAQHLHLPSDTQGAIIFWLFTCCHTSASFQPQLSLLATLAQYKKKIFYIASFLLAEGFQCARRFSHLIHICEITQFKVYARQLACFL